MRHTSRLTSPLRARRRRLVAAIAGAAGTCALWLAPAASQAATTPALYVIGVDHGSPAGHSFEYADFFPRTGINVHNGDILDFKVASDASTDGLHVVGLLKQGVTVAQAFSDPANALIVPDADEPGAPPLQNLPVFGGSAPPPDSGAPGACGSQTTPCTYTGAGQIWSGEVGPGSDYFVKLALPTGFTGAVNAVDFGHPIDNTAAAINVVADTATASTQADLDSAAAAQAQADTSGALSAEAAASTDRVTANPDGTHTHNVHVGAATQYVEVMENLPATVKVARGDHVTWTTGGISDPHTVQFPPNAFQISPFSAPAQCEGSGGDTPSPAGPEAGPPDFGCPAGATPEASLIVAPQGTPTIHSPSYRMVSADGGVFNFGQSAYYGSAAPMHPRFPVVAVAATGDQKGYYEVTANGGVFTFGDARFFGSMAGKALSAPIVSVLTDPFGQAYLLVGADGKTYGFGSGVPPIGGVPSHLASPVVGVAVSNNPNGPPGFFMATKAGGVITVSGAPYLGSMGGKHLAAPIVGISSTPDGHGYWLVGSDGGIFTFGDAPYLGSMGGKHLASPIKGMVSTPDGRGYWLVASDGGVFSFGDAAFHGSMGGTHLNSPVVGIDSTASLASSGVLINIPPGNPNAITSRTSYTFTFADPGSYGFQCGFHEMMTGTVLVS